MCSTTVVGMALAPVPDLDEHTPPATGVRFIGPNDHETRVEALDERIGLLAAQIHALEAELAETVAELDDCDGWHGVGYRSLAHWLSVRTKFTMSDARRLATVATRLERVPTLLHHAKAGQISLGVLASAARVSSPDNETRVAQIALDCTPTQSSRILATYRDLRPSFTDPDPATPPEPEPEPAYWWNTWIDDTGRGRISAALDPLTLELIEQAWNAARTTGEHETANGDPNGEHLDRLNPNEIAARLAATMIDHAHHTGLRAPDGEKFLIQLNIDLTTLARVLGISLDPSLPIRLGSESFLAHSGQHLSDDDVQQFLCDAGIQVLVHHNGVPLWLSNEHRTFNRHQRRALRFRASGRGGCEFPGCPHTRYLQVHHVTYHSHGGPTALDNAVLLCGYHHRTLHRDHWTITTAGDQTFTFWDGQRCLGTTTRTDAPGGPPPDLQHLPGLDHPPDPRIGLDADAPRSTTHGQPLTPYALDAYLSMLLAA